MRWGGLLVLVLLCSGCATAGTDESKSLSRRASGEARPVIVGTAPGGSTRYHGAGEIVGKDTLSVFAVEGHTRLQIGYGEKLSQIDLDDSARLRLIEGLRKTFPICDSAKKGEIKGVTVTPRKWEMGGQSKFTLMAVDSMGIYRYGEQASENAEPVLTSPKAYSLRDPVATGTTGRCWRLAKVGPRLAV